MPDAIQSQIIYEGRLFSVERRSFTDASGRAVIREIVHHPGAVVIVPVRDDGTLVLIRNHRIAVDQRLWELPAGTLEPAEPPDVAARRELEEETGYRAERLEPLAQFYTSPGFLSELLHVFVARSLSFVGPNLDPGEDIEAVALPAKEVLAMIDRGEIRDGKTIASILLWSRRRDDVSRSVTPPPATSGEHRP